MTTIHVLFPVEGRPLVMNDPEAVVTGQPFTWAVRSENPAVSRVEIHFPSGERYFPGSPDETRCEKPLLDGLASMWGKAPHKGTDARIEAKYTIYGKDGSGKEIVSLDPKILPTDP